MRITDYVASLTLCASLLGTPACARAEGDTTQKASIDELTQAEVDTLMQRSSVDEILKEEYLSGRVQKVEYKNGKTNFRELVYQEHLSVAERKPVIMLVVRSNDTTFSDKTTYVSDKTVAIHIKNRINELRDVKFVVYDPTIDPSYKQIDDEQAGYGVELNREGVSRTPSIIIFSLWDFTNGENKTHNNGDIKKLDVLAGGTTKQDVMKFHNGVSKWEDSNIIGNNQYVWRTNNTLPRKFTKITI